MKRIITLAAAGFCVATALMSALADEPMTHAQLQALFPGTFSAVVRGSMQVTFTAKGNGVLIGQATGRSDNGRWSLQDGKLCIMLNSWTKGKSTCSVVLADSGWYYGKGVKFRKI